MPSNTPQPGVLPGPVKNSSQRPVRPSTGSTLGWARMVLISEAKMKRSGLRVKKNGFTLAELLGVVIIIGVLALLLLPTIDKATQENKQGLYETQIKNIKQSNK